MPPPQVGAHTIQGQTGIQLLVQPGAAPTHQLPRDDGGFSSPKNLPTSLKRGPCPDNMTVVAYINHQGGMRLHSLYSMVRCLLLWVQCNLLSLWAVHMPGRQNQGADMLSRDNVAQGEWRLHPQVFERAEVYFFASEDNYHWPTYFSSL